MTTVPTFAGMNHIDAETVTATLTPDGAAAGLEAALRAGVDPEHDGERSRLTTQTGELLLMPSTDGRYAGIKVLSSTVDNATRNMPQIQGAYLMFEGPAQRPCAVIDGIALTSLRTPAVTLLGLRHLVAPAPEGGRRAVVVGAGTQARAHALALATSRDVPVRHITLVGRETDLLAGIAEAIAAAPGAEGVTVETVDSGTGTGNHFAAVADADIVVTCTSAPTPLFDGALVRDEAVVVAMGSHFPDTRETDDALASRAHVVLESRAATLREAGDVMIPLGSGVLAPERLTTLRDVVLGTPPATDRPRLFKFTGMPWEDLAVAVTLHEACSTDRS